MMYAKVRQNVFDLSLMSDYAGELGYLDGNCQKSGTLEKKLIHRLGSLFAEVDASR